MEAADLGRIPMTVRLELKPDIEANLVARARAMGIPLDSYLQGVIEDLARGKDTPVANLQQFRATLDLLAEMGRSLPQLPSAAVTRESIYQDCG